MSYIRLSIMCSLFMGLYLPSTKAMESTSDEMALERDGLPKIMLWSSGEMATEEKPSQYSQHSQFSQWEQLRSSTNIQYTQGNPLTDSENNSQNSQDIPIEAISSIKTVKQKIDSLCENGVKRREICIVMDCHGVIMEQVLHASSLTVAPDMEDCLSYLNEEDIFLEKEKIPSLVATGWPNFDEVIRDSSKVMNLKEYFGVDLACYNDPHYISKEETFILGPDKKQIRGHRNGRFLALRAKKADEPYFYGKAFGIELIYPDKIFKHIFFVDNENDRIKDFNEDSYHLSHTRRAEYFEELHLYHLTY